VEGCAFGVFFVEDLFVDLAGAGDEVARRGRDEVRRCVRGDNGAFVADGRRGFGSFDGRRTMRGFGKKLDRLGDHLAGGCDGRDVVRVDGGFSRLGCNGVEVGVELGGVLAGGGRNGMRGGPLFELDGRLEG
jgi:hypothetical protein